MARFKVYGKLEGGKGTAATKGAQDVVRAYVQTEQGRIEVQLNHLGSFTVTFQPVRNTYGNEFTAGAAQQLLKGNVNDLTVLMGSETYLPIFCETCDAHSIVSGEELALKAHWQETPEQPVTCKLCDGWGWVHLAEEKSVIQCPRCQAIGARSPEKPYLSTVNAPDVRECRACGGNKKAVHTEDGVQRMGICSVCGGDGVRRVEEGQ